MTDVDKVFAGSIPDIYDDFLVPLIFETHAEDLARRVAACDPLSVLETAAGSGVVTRALAPRLTPEARYAVTDLNPPMLERAESRQPTDARITWRPADALALPFEDACFDVVCCQFGVMFFPDRVAGFREARRVLRPGGRWVFNVWDRISENEFADHVTRAAGEVFPDDPPRFLARTPHGYHDTEQIAADLRTAGFNRIEVEVMTGESRASSARDPAIAYCQGTPLRNEIEARDPGRLQEVTERAEAVISEVFGAGPVSGRIQGIVITASL